MSIRFKEIAIASIWSCILTVVLFADGPCELYPNWICFGLRDFGAVFGDSGTQWIFFYCLVIYSIMFHVCDHFRKVTCAQKSISLNVWLIYVIFISTVFYSINYSPSTQAVVLIFGVLLACGIVVSFSSLPGKFFSLSTAHLQHILVSLQIMLLTLASILNLASNPLFEYRGHLRLCGPWGNPNIFGMLMGTGAMLAFGQLFKGLNIIIIARRERGAILLNQTIIKLFKNNLSMCALGLAFILLARGLLLSYSRGAWVGTTCGLAYMMFGYKCRKSRFRWRMRNSVCALFIPASSILILSMWHLNRVDFHPAWRILSSVNMSDFSWRNRIAAWEGAMQIISESPCFGGGWGRPEILYNHYYLSSKLSEHGAIGMNDYLMLGATLGVPALFCFGMYIWFTLTQSAECRVRSVHREEEIKSRHGKNGNETLEIERSEWLKTTCRASVIVLLVGFCFDGGLFQLPTASMFWILLEMSAVSA